MFQRYAFIAVFGSLLTGLGAWSARVELQRAVSGSIPHRASLEKSAKPDLPVAAELGGSKEENIEQHLDLVETLEKVVSYEHSYRRVYGYFTKLLARTGMVIPPSLATTYEIRISEATSDHFLVTAFSERNGKTAEWATLDENYVLHSNFSLPQPRIASLRFQAQRHLQALLSAPEGRPPVEQGVYRGFFKYEVRRDSESRKIAFAVGIKSPVQGIELETQEGQLLTGLDAEKLTELTRFAEASAEASVEASSDRTIDSTQEKMLRKIASEPKASGARLEIEPIDSEE